MGFLDKLKETVADLGIDIPISDQQNMQIAQNYSQPLAQQTPPQQTSNKDLYNPQLEKLIDLALADGELTEKEKQVLFKKAETMGVDLDEFEMVLDARLYQHNKASNSQPTSASGSIAAPNSSKFGDVKKCPACGAMIQSFTTKCTECGYEFRNIGVNQGIERLFEMLNEVEAQSKEDATSLIGGMAQFYGKSFASAFGGDKTTRRKKSIIQNFPIPTTKEDILDFLSLAVPNAKVSFWSTDDSAKEMAPVWKAKCEQIIMKAKFCMKDDKETLAEVAAYAKQLKIKF